MMIDIDCVSASGWSGLAGIAPHHRAVDGTAPRVVKQLFFSLKLADSRWQQNNCSQTASQQLPRESAALQID